MKKLALIILMAVYALAIAGAGIAPVMAEAHSICPHSNLLADGNNGGDAGNCSNEACNAGFTGFTAKEHPNAVRHFHFSTRHFVKSNEYSQRVTAPAISTNPVFSASTQLPGQAVPAYILHCVYRI